MMANIWWSLPLTLVVFFAARKLAARFKMPLLNPLLVAMVVIIPFLLLTGIPYERYFAGSKILNDLLQPAVVALAFPLYEQLHQIRARWKSIITICFVGSLVAMITGTSVALLMGASPQIAASILPKSVTTPIAMAVGGSLGGIPAISAMCVIFVGILGAVFGHTLLNACAFIPKLRGAWRWGQHRTPWVPHAAQNWIIRKGRLAHWHWSSAGSSPPCWPRSFSR
jgi:predicted murein hydrolase (TIGR00659 family)